MHLIVIGQVEMSDNTRFILLEGAMFFLRYIIPEDFHILVSVRPALMAFFLLPIYRFDKPSEMVVALHIWQL